MKVRDALGWAQFTLIGIAFAVLSAGVPAGGSWNGWMPDLTPVPLFFFLVYRPDRVPMLAVLAVGLVADLLYGRLPGTGALALLVAGEAARFGLSSALSVSSFGRAILLAGCCAAHAILLTVAYIPAGDVSLTALWRQSLWATVSYLPFALLLRHVFRIRPGRKPELVR